MKSVASAVDLEALNLTAAIRILEHAGRRVPDADSEDSTARLQALIDGLCDLSMHDGLTGLVNATFFRATLASELDRSARTGRPCALLLLDLDRFKSINDTHGHVVGDGVLEAVGRLLKKSLRSMDFAARIGGEEFAVMLPECGAEEAVRAAHRVHSILCPITVTIGDLSLQVTASGGLAWTEPCLAYTPTMLLARADAELYRAKQTGRRRLCHAVLIPTCISTAEHAAVIPPALEEDAYEH